MKNYNTVAFGSVHHDFGVVNAVADVAVFDVIDKLFSRHNRAVVLRFGGGSAEVGDTNNVGNTQKLFAGEVGYVRSNLAAFKRFDKVGNVCKITAREVDNANAVLHLCDVVLVDDALGGGKRGDVIGNIIRFCIDSIVIVCLANRTGDRPSVFNGDIRVAADNLHLDIACGVCNHTADRAETDNAESFALDFGADELAFALFNLLCNVGSALE